MQNSVEGVSQEGEGQLTTLVCLHLQGELGLPGPPGVPGLIVSTPMPGKGRGKKQGVGNKR